MCMCMCIYVCACPHAWVAVERACAHVHLLTQITQSHTCRKAKFEKYFTCKFCNDQRVSLVTQRTHTEYRVSSTPLRHSVDHRDLESERMHLDVSIVASRGAVLELSRLVTRRSSLGEGVGVKVDVVFDEGRDEKVRVVVAYARTHVSKEVSTSRSQGHLAKRASATVTTTTHVPTHARTFLHAEVERDALGGTRLCEPGGLQLVDISREEVVRRPLVDEQLLKDQRRWNRRLRRRLARAPEAVAGRPMARPLLRSAELPRAARRALRRRRGRGGALAKRAL
jgi:hypothetical protein